MDVDLPYKAEYSKTNRASCKGCKSKIDQGELRIAVMVQVGISLDSSTSFIKQNRACIKIILALFIVCCTLISL